MSHSDLTSIVDVTSDEETNADSDAAIPQLQSLKKNLNIEFLEPAPKPVKVVATVPGQDHMRVFLRIRPFSDAEIQKKESQGCMKVESERTLTVNAPEGSHTFKNSQHGCGKQTHHFTFTKIFSEDTTQKEFFDNTVLGTVKDFIEGQNCLVFTYGVTNSGKTYTIQGNPQDGGILPRSLDVIFNSLKDKLWKDMSLKPRMFSDVARLSSAQEEQEQLLKENTLKMADGDEPDMTTLLGDEANMRPSLTMSEDSLDKEARISTCSIDTATTADAEQEKVKELFDEAENRVREDGRVSVENQSMMKFSIWVSFTEVYNEYIYDLLEPIPKKKKNFKRPVLIMREDKNGIPYVKGLKQIQVTSADEAYKILTIGKQNLQVAGTKLNHNSSRSHCIFTIKVLRVVDKDNPTHARVSMLSFCDLAGAERSGKTQNVGDRMKEAGNINTSLLALGNCIKALRHNQMFRDQQRIVPFRDSKLTRLFQSFFCGKGKAAMMVNVNQCASAFDETLHALKYSAIAKQVITIQEPPKEKKSMPVIGSRRVLDSLALAPTPSGKIRSRATIAWATPGTIAQDALEQQLKIEEEDEEESDYSFSSREQELLDIITALKDELVTEKRRMLSLEMEIREEVCEEMSKQIVQIENNYGELLQEERNRAEEKAEKRIQLLMKSVKKDRKRRRVTDDDGNDHDDEYVSSILLHQAEVKVTALEKELAELKEEMQAGIKERDSKQQELSKAQFEAADLRTQMHKLQTASNSGDSDVAHSEVVSSLHAQLSSLREELQEKTNELAEMNEMLTEAGETFHQKEIKLNELEQRCKEQEEALGEMQQIAEESRRAMETANDRLQVKKDYITELEQKLDSTSASQECRDCVKLKSQVEELKNQLSESAAALENEQKQLHDTLEQLRKVSADAQLQEEKVEKSVESLQEESPVVSNLLAEVAHLNQQLAESQKKTEELNANDETRRLCITDLETKCAHHDSIVKQLQKQLADTQQELKASSSGKSHEEKELIETKEKLRDIETRYLELKVELEKKERKMEEVRRSVCQTVEEKADAVKKLKTELNDVKEKLHSVESKYLALTIEIERKDRKIEEHGRISVSATEKVKMLEQTLQEANAAVRESMTEAAQLKEKCQLLEKECSALKKEGCSAEMKDKYSMLERERDAHKADCAQAEANLQKQTVELENALAVTATFRNDLDRLKGQLEEHESCEQRLVESQNELDDYILKVNEQVLLIAGYEDKAKEQSKNQNKSPDDDNPESLNVSILKVNEQVSLNRKCEDEAKEQSTNQHKSPDDDNQTSVLQSKVAELESRLERERKQHKDAASDLDSLLQQKSVNIEELNTTISTLNNRLQAMKKIEDKLHEVESERHSLERKVISQEQFAASASSMEEKVQEQIQNCQTEITTLQEQLSTFKAKEAEAQQLVKTLENDVSTLKASLMAAENYAEDIKELEERLKARGDELVEAKRQVKTLEEVANRAEVSHISDNEREEKLNARIRELEGLVCDAEYKVQMNSRQLGREKRQVESRLKEKEEEMKATEKKLAELQQTLTELEERNSKGDSELLAKFDEQKKKADRLESIVDDLEKCLTSSKTAHEGTSQQVDKLHARCKKLEADLHEYENQLEDTTCARDSLSNQLNEVVQEHEKALHVAQGETVSLRQQLQEVHMKWEHATECLKEKSALQKRVGEASLQLQQGWDDAHKLKQALLDSQQQLELKETHNHGLEKQLASLEDKLKIETENLRKRVVELEKELTAKNSALEELSTKLEASVKNGSTLEQKVNELTASLGEKEDELNSHISNTDATYTQLQKEHNVIIKAKNELVGQLLESKDELSILQQQLEEKSELLAGSQLETEKMADLKAKNDDLLANQETLKAENTQHADIITELKQQLLAAGEQEKEIEKLQGEVSVAEEQAEQIAKLEKQLADAGEQAQLIAELKSQLTAAANEQVKRVAELENALTESTKRCKELEEVENCLSTLRDECAEMTKTLQQRETSIESCNKEIVLLKEETANLNQQVEKMTISEAAIKDSMAALRTELDTKDAKIADLKHELKKKATAETDHKALLDDLDKAVARENHLRQQLREATQAQEEQNVKFNLLNAKLQTSQDEVEKHGTTVKTANTTIKSLKDELTSSQQQHKATTQELEEVQRNSKSQVASRDDEIAKLKEEVEKKENKIRQRSNTITGLMSKLDAERNSYEIALRDAKVNERIIETMKKAMDEQEETMATQDKVLQDREQRITQLLKDYDDEVKKNDELRKSSRSNSSAVEDLNDKISRLETERKRLEQSCFTAETKLREAKCSYEDTERKRAKLHHDLQDKNRDIQALEKKLTESQRHASSALDHQTQLAKVQSQIEQERKAGHDSDHRLSILKSKFQVLEERNKGLEEQRDRLEAEVKRLQQQQQQSSNQDCEVELKKFREDRDKLVSQLEGILRENTSKMAEMQRKLKDVSADCHSLKRELQDKDETIAELSAHLDQGNNTRARRGRRKAAAETHEEAVNAKQMSGPSEAEAAALKEVENLHRQLDEQHLNHNLQMNKVIHAKDAIINELRDTNLQLQTQIPVTKPQDENAVFATPSEPAEESEEQTTTRGRRRATRGSARPRKRKSSETESNENMTPQEVKEPSSGRQRVSRQSTANNKRRGRRTAQMQVSFTEGGPLDTMPIKEEDVMDLSNAEILSVQSSRTKKPLGNSSTNQSETPSRTFISPDKSLSMSSRKKKRLLNVEDELFQESPPLESHPAVKIHDDTPKQVLRTLRTRSTRSKKNTAV